ncbi:MAG: folate-binding protein YgfZ [Cellvibrionales bacterium]|nr:folate-binding protein YgfZ [Cellvibrionales bacterium]
MSIQNKSTWPAFAAGDAAARAGFTPIDSHAVLKVRGVDAVRFLQGQCTADVAALASGQTCAAAICTVKGRIVTSFTATRTADGLLLKMHRSLVQPSIDYLQKFAAFFKVELNAWEAPCVLATDHPPLCALGVTVDYRLNKTRFAELLVPATNLEAMLALLEAELAAGTVRAEPETNWCDALLEAGWLVLDAQSSQTYLPHQLGLERLGAVSFTKGCYTGQEIIARTEYRGAIKRRLLKLTCKNLPPDIQVPTELRDNASKKAGELLAVSHHGTTALAILATDIPPQGSLYLGEHSFSYRLADD